MKFNNASIGIFDSGLGGLTVFKEIKKILPHEDLIYFGDTARVPYGNKSQKTIIKYSSEILEFLIAKGVKIVVVACNTSSSLALSHLRKKSSVPVFGVIEPGAKKAARVVSGANKPCNIAIIGTSATIKSGAYTDAIKKEMAFFRPNRGIKQGGGFKITEKACPLFVPLVEEGFVSDEITKSVIKYYFASLVKEKPSCLVLGCTHYPVLKDLISAEIGENTEIIDSGTCAAGAVKDYLEKNKMLKAPKILKSGTAVTAGIAAESSGGEIFFVSDDIEKFKEIGGRFLGRALENVVLADLDKYPDAKADSIFKI